MASGEYISDLQAVDFALGGVIAGAFENLADSGPEAFRRFLRRPVKEKLYFARNDDIQDVLRRIARRESDLSPVQTAIPAPATSSSTAAPRPPKAASIRQGPDLPVVVYYREPGLTGDQNQRPAVVEVSTLREAATAAGASTSASAAASGAAIGQPNAVRLTTLPLTLTYSMLFLAWDRATIERMGVAWFGYVAPLRRKRTRFFVPYLVEGEQIDVPSTISAPREILSSSEDAGEGVRLWGARTMVEVNTQALYGAAVQVQDYLTVIGGVRLAQ